MRNFTDYEGMAMLELSESERALIRESFDEIAGRFSVLDEFDVAGVGGVEPLVSVLDLNSILREDVAASLMSRDELLKNAPEQYDGYFQVPAAIE